MTKLTQNNSIQNQGSLEVHSPFIPVEIRNGEPVRANLVIKGKSDLNIEVAVWRLSPFGIELASDKSNDEQIASLNMGSQVDLTVMISGQKCEFFGLLVARTAEEMGRRILGIRWCAGLNEDGQAQKKETLPFRKEERRKSRRWLCGEEFMPTGIAPNPSRFNDFIHFRVRDISKTGVQLLTSLRNKYLIPGMRLESTVSFPMFAQLQINLQIKDVRIVSQFGKDYLSIGAVMVRPDQRILDTVAQYILQFSPAVEPSELKDEGLHVPNLGSALSFSYVKTDSDYNSVLELRKLAYSKAGKCPSDIPVSAMGDIYDTRGRILMARYKGKLVGTVRVLFHNPEDEMEHDRFVKLPDHFPRRDEMVEVTRLCTHPDFRGSDLALALIKQMILTVAQSKRRWLFSSATESTLGFYKKVGAQTSGLVFKHGDLNGLQHEAFLIDVPNALAGVGLGPIFWNAMFSDLSNYTRDQGILEYDSTMNFRIGLYRMFKPLASFLKNRMEHPRR